MISKTYSVYDSSLASCLKKLQEDFANDFENADFLFFAIHPDFEAELINKKIRETFNTDKFLAFHAVDHFDNNKIIKSGITLCAVQFQKTAKIEIFYIEDIKKDNMLSKTANYLNANKDKFHIIFTGICDGKIAAFIEKLSEKIEYEPLDNIIGGVSSGNLEANEVHTFQFIDNKIIKNGFVIISFENISYSMDVSLGFRSYGITYKVTKAEGTKLYNIDEGKSASYMATKMLQNVGVEDFRYLWYVPFTMLSKQDGYATSLRTIAKITDDYVELFGPVQEGDFFKLSFATPEDLISEDKKIARKIIKKVTNPELSFNFSCIARGYVLEDKRKQENEAYIDVFHSNLFGFFTFGEIGPDKMYKKLTFYNETSLVAVIREI